MERQSPNLQLKSEIGTVFFSSTTMCRYCRSSDASFISCSHPKVFSDGLLPQIVCDTCDHRDSLPGHSSDHRVLLDMSCSLKKLKIHFVITAFNRPQMLKRLLEQIFEQASDYEIHVDVFEDGGVDPSPELVGFSNLTLFRREANGGKIGFWHLIHLAFQRIEQVHADYYFFLQDDIEIPAGCLTRSIEQLKAISDATCDCLNLLFDESRGGKPSWTGFKPHLALFGDHLFCKTQWTDMLFLARRSFLNI
jgi:hypothetical protein